MNVWYTRHIEKTCEISRKGEEELRFVRYWELNQVYFGRGSEKRARTSFFVPSQIRSHTSITKKRQETGRSCIAQWLKPLWSATTISMATWVCVPDKLLFYCQLRVVNICEYGRSSCLVARFLDPHVRPPKFLGRLADWQGRKASISRNLSPNRSVSFKNFSIPPSKCLLFTRRNSICKFGTLGPVCCIWIFWANLTGLSVLSLFQQLNLKRTHASLPRSSSKHRLLRCWI